MNTQGRPEGQGGPGFKLRMSIALALLLVPPSFWLFPGLPSSLPSGSALALLEIHYLVQLVCCPKCE